MHFPFRLRLPSLKRVQRASLSVIALLAGLPSLLCARDFTVAVYNVENLFDADGVAAYDDYKPHLYKPAHLRTKLLNTAEAVSRLTNDGKGPDIILFQEVEADQTPSRTPVDLHALIAPDAGRKVADLLPSDPASSLDPNHADWPSEAWLLKALEDRGLTGYSVVVGSDAAAPGERFSPAIKNVIFTRFPVLEVRQHPLKSARNIVEVLVTVDGAKLRLFANHWKSGASDPKTEKARVENARVLRARLDAVFAEDPQCDVILGGDFNSQYNQSERYPQMGETGINSVLRSQGNETLLPKGGADLYNLWYELPVPARGSDVYQGEWGTLMQMIVSRGLYDGAGVQYVDNSFRVAKLPGLNATGTGMPRRWVRADGPAGSGCSDHFPIVASFTTRPVTAATRSTWITLSNPSLGAPAPEPVRTKLSYSELRASALDLESIPANANLRDGSFTGKIIRVSGARVLTNKSPIKVIVRKADWEVYLPDPELRKALASTWQKDEEVAFYGEVGQYKGRWQFVIREAGWLLKSK